MINHRRIDRIIDTNGHSTVSCVTFNHPKTVLDQVPFQDRGPSIDEQQYCEWIRLTFPVGH